MIARARRLPGSAIAAFALCAALAAGERASAADETEVKQAIAKVLEVGWDTTPQARAAANQQFTEAAAVTGADLRLLRAWTLVLLQQWRYEEASKRVDQWLARDEDDWFALRARVWLSTLLKNYSAALVSAERLAEQISTAPEETESLEARNEAATALGRIYGFLGGPAASALNQDERRESEKKVLALLDEQRQIAFKDARDNVLQRFLELSDSKADERDRAREAGEEKREKTLQEIDLERKDMARRADELKEQRDKLRSELSDELADIQKQDRPLVTTLARLDAQAAAINRDLISIQQQINILESDAAREKDPVLRERLRREADRLRFQGSRIDNDLVALQRQGAVVQSQRAALARRQQDAQNNFGGQINRIDKESSDMQKREKRLSAEETRAKRPISTTTSKVLSLSAQAAALSSYDTLPLEETRQQLLEELRP